MVDCERSMMMSKGCSVSGWISIDIHEIVETTRLLALAAVPLGRLPGLSLAEMLILPWVSLLVRIGTIYLYSKLRVCTLFLPGRSVDSVLQHLLCFCWCRWNQQYHSSFQIHVSIIVIFTSIALRRVAIPRRLSNRDREEGSQVYWWHDILDGIEVDWRSRKGSSHQKTPLFWWLCWHLACIRRIEFYWKGSWYSKSIFVGT